MDLAAEAARLRDAAEARPLKLPVRRRVEESHHAVTPDGLSVWFTIQESPHSRIFEAVFERSDRPPDETEIRPWLDHLFGAAPPMEAPGIPGSLSRRFELFEHDPELEAPLA
jgi:hypothetical protein